MDIKVDGLSMDVMREALSRHVRVAFTSLTQCMSALIMPVLKLNRMRHAWKKLFIDKEFIGAVIGPQGKVIQEIQKETGTTINIEEVGNYGEVSFSPSKEGLDKSG